MTKVEELRGKIIDMAQGVSFADISTFLHLLDDLHAEGVAEGAEQMKETIRDNSLHYRQFDKMEPNIVAGEHNDYAFAQENLFVVLASILAPTKEKP